MRRRAARSRREWAQAPIAPRGRILRHCELRLCLPGALLSRQPCNAKRGSGENHQLRGTLSGAAGAASPGQAEGRSGEGAHSSRLLRPFLSACSLRGPKPAACQERASTARDESWLWEPAGSSRQPAPTSAAYPGSRFSSGQPLGGRRRPPWIAARAPSTAVRPAASLRARSCHRCRWPARSQSGHQACASPPW